MHEGKRITQKYSLIEAWGIISEAIENEATAEEEAPNDGPISLAEISADDPENYLRMLKIMMKDETARRRTLIFFHSNELPDAITRISQEKKN